MSENQKVLIVSIGLIALGVYFISKQKKQDAETVKEDTTSAVKTDWDKVLKKGSKGIEVGILQKALRQLVVDEDFGDQTEARLKKVMRVTQTSLNDYNKFINKK
jgi:hypothetical protein